MFIYLASAIDRNDHSKHNFVYNKLLENLTNTIIFDPATAFGVTGMTVSEVVLVEINAWALIRSDAVVAIYQKGVESWGLPIEISKAAERHIPIYLLYDVMDGNYDTFPIYLRHLVPIGRCFSDIASLTASLDFSFAKESINA
jgi:hypothetical protein